MRCPADVLRDLLAAYKRLTADNAKLKEELKQAKLLAECECPACGDTVYFHKLGGITCGCGGGRLELTVNTTEIGE